MASTGARIVGLDLVFGMVMMPSLAKDYTVGDTSGWATGVDYTTWTSDKTFAAGDTLEKLQYFECRGLNNILVEYDHGRLHGLRYLAVIDPLENMKELMNTTTRVSNTPVYRNLEGLLLSGLTYLKELCIGGLPPGSLCNLKTLEVGYCPNLENALLPSKLLQRLQNLEKLICVNMMKMDYVFGCQGLKQEESILTKLEELHLSGLYSLKKLCVGESPPGSLCNLKIIKVEDCGNLLNTFLPSKLLRGLQNVKELIRRGIDKGMEYVFGREGLEPCSIHESLCNLKILEVEVVKGERLTEAFLAS